MGKMFNNRNYGRCRDDRNKRNKKCLLDKNQNFPGVFGWAISTVLALMIRYKSSKFELNHNSMTQDQAKGLCNNYLEAGGGGVGKLEGGT